MTQKNIHNFIWIPLFSIGFGAVGLGSAWLIHPQPWMLDQQPNEELLRISFHTLLASNVNAHLPDYLLVIYRFFGWWIISIGLLIMVYIQVTKMGTALARNAILGVLLIILIGIAYMVFNFIPLSPFKIVLYMQSVMWITSAYFSTQLKD
tara:strand:+ start:741 stop:1190 length:450 start_codon:yes stop_codon:yes gene_type:complete